MDMKQAIVSGLAQADFIVGAYLADLTPAEILVRPVPGANHVAWQLGHLIASERYLVDKALPGRMAALPAGLADRHTKQTAESDKAEDFLTKDEYVHLGKEVRASTLRLVENLAPEEFDQPVGKGLPPVVKTAGQALLFLGTHWLMHAGQWAILRRKLGRAPLF